MFYFFTGAYFPDLRCRPITWVSPQLNLEVRSKVWSSSGKCCTSISSDAHDYTVIEF